MSSQACDFPCFWITGSSSKGPDQAQALPQSPDIVMHPPSSSKLHMVRTRCTENQFLQDNLDNSCVILRLCGVRGKEELPERFCWNQEDLFTAEILGTQKPEMLPTGCKPWLPLLLWHSYVGFQHRLRFNDSGTGCREVIFSIAIRPGERKWMDRWKYKGESVK